MTVSIASIPSYSDLGDSSSVTKNAWESQLQRYSTYEYYYSGNVFEETVEDAEIADPPSLYPVGINIVKMLVQSLADATFGEWDTLPVWFTGRKGLEETRAMTNTAQLLDKILFRSNTESNFLEMELHRMLYGNSVLRIMPDDSNHLVKWAPIKPPAFFPVFHPHDRERLLQATVLMNISREQAKLVYGYDTKKDEVLFEEYWDLEEHYVKIDQKLKVKKYSGRNPYGVVPFVYIPRMRSFSVFGDSVASDVIPVQDEINMRVADIGEAVNLNAHPTRWGKNLPKSFTNNNYPVGSDVLWDLGRAFGEHQPEVGILEVKNPIPSGSQEHIEWLYDWVRTSTFAPPIAFGEDTGGGQRSGITLEIRMLPLIKAVRKHRAYLRTGLRNATYISGKILAQRQWSDVQSSVVRTLLDGDVEADFAEVLPRDRAGLVDEVVKRLSTSPPSIALPSALKMLSSDASELDRIREMIEEFDLDENDKEPKEVEENAQASNKDKVDV